MEWYRIHKAPLVLGHEVTGEIVETGEGVKRFKKATGYSCLIMCPVIHVIIV